MKRTLLSLLLVGSIAVLLTQCKHEAPEMDENKGTEVKDTTPISKSDTCSFDTIYFVSEIKPIFNNFCATSGCHDAATASDGVILDTYDNIIETGDIEAFDISAGDIYKRITHDDADKVMPPGGRLTPEQINAIKVWINQGALNNACQNTCFSDSFAYSKYIWPIVDGSCKGCHRNNGGSGGVSLSNYAQIKAAVDNGSFEGTIYHQQGFKPMPPGGSLDSCSKEKIKKWIAAGAPNN